MTRPSSSPPGGATREIPGPLRPHPALSQYYTNEQERQQRVNAWFDESASHYDSITQAMSLGSGHRYRKDALLRAGLTKGMRMLDVACGTGVIAAHAQDIVGESGRAIGVDRSAGMLHEAHRRGVRSLVQAAAEGLPFKSEGFDFLSMGFALRHVTDLRGAFREYLRVLKPGGKVLILEITPPRSRLLFSMLKFYMNRIVPLVARLGRGGQGAQVLMEYYWGTIETCVSPQVILEAFKEAGFSSAKRGVVLGIFSEYVAVR